MVASATITVNKNRTEGKVAGGSESKVMKDVLTELKGIGGVLSKALKLNLSGFGGMGGKAGLVAAVVAGSAAAGLVIADQIKKGRNREGLEGFGFDKVMFEGEESIAQVDIKTKKIVDILTLEEAKKEGILDRNGMILNGLELQDSIQKEIYKGLEAVRDLQIIDVETLGRIGAGTLVEEEIQKEINIQKKIKAERLAEQNKEVVRTDFGSSESNTAVLNLGQGPLSQQAALNEMNSRTQRAEDFENLIKLSPVIRWPGDPLSQVGFGDS